MNELKRLTKIYCSSIMSVLLWTIAVVRVPRILILLQARAKTNTTFEIRIDELMKTSIKYQPRSIAVSYVFKRFVSFVFYFASPPSAPFSSFSKNSMQMKTRTITLNTIMNVFRAYLKMPSYDEKC